MSHEIHPESGRPVVPEPARPLARKGEEAVEEQKTRAASSANAMARALDIAADSLSSDGHPLMADAATRAARELEDLGDSLGSQNPRELFADLRRFAHRSPTAFIGLAAALGFGLARFFESADEERSRYVEEQIPTTPVAHETAPTGREGVLP